MARKASAKKTTAAAPKATVVERNYTIAGLIAIVAVVLITGIYFTPHVADQARDLTGNAYATAQDTTPKPTCEVNSICDGSKLVRQNSDCSQFVAYCTYGCDAAPDGARCR